MKTLATIGGIGIGAILFGLFGLTAIGLVVW
jgi:hypothetical protein